MLAAGKKNKCNTTITHTLDLDTAAEIKCLRSGETFKWNICVKAVAVCVSATLSHMYKCEESQALIKLNNELHM